MRPEEWLKQTESKPCLHCKKPIYGVTLKDGTWSGQLYCVYCGKAQVQ